MFPTVYFKKDFKDLMNLLEKNKGYVAASCILCHATAVVFCVCRYLIVF